MRIRITYETSGSLIYTSTLDIQKLWERSIRRTGLQLQYSQGFHPQPRIQIANPLPLGFSGLNELVDVWLVDEETEEITENNIVKIEEKSLDDMKSLLSRHMPTGIIIKNVTEIIPENSPSLPKQIQYSEYSVSFYVNKHKLEDLSKMCSDFMDRETIERIRMRKSYDLRPLIFSLSVVSDSDSEFHLNMRTNAGPGKAGRPDEVMDELGFERHEYQVARTRLIFADKYK